MLSHPLPRTNLLQYGTLKKLSQKQRRRNIRKSLLAFRRRRSATTSNQVKVFLTAVRPLPEPSETRFGRRTIPVLRAPEHLSLTHNFVASLGFVYAARRLLYSRRGHSSRVRWRLDFEPIQRIGPAAALVLAAELDRWTYLHGRAPRAFVETWQPYVQTVFHDLGLLPLLGLPQYDRPAGGSVSTLKFLPFMRGRLTQGADAETLRNNVEGVAGLRLSAPHAIYGALCEAMTNVLQHAYRFPDAAWPAPYVKCWWAKRRLRRGNQNVAFLHV